MWNLALQPSLLIEITMRRLVPGSVFMMLEINGPLWLSEHAWMITTLIM